MDPGIREKLLAPETAKLEMARMIEQAVAAWAHRPDETEFKVHRLTLPIQSVDVYDWMAAQEAAVKFLWAGRDDHWRMGGIGKADVVTGSFADAPGAVVERCRRYMRPGSSFRYYGGFSFQEEATEDESWYRFGASRFILPRFELIQYGEITYLVTNLLLRRDHELPLEQVLRELEGLEFPEAAEPPDMPAITARTDLPERDAWDGMVLTALDMIANEVLEKIVLARKARFSFEREVDAFRIMARLRALTSNCYHFSFQPEPGVAFMGTTPERLYKRDGRMLSSEVLAGTRPRSKEEAADRILSEDLLGSSKDQWEHDIVRKSMRQNLHLLCEYLDIDERAHLLRLERKQHLQSFVAGKLKDVPGDADLLEQLHPTPAVGGYPRENALAEIRRLEPFCRGWYAAPIGWVGLDSAEFAVAIRSGLVEGEQVSVYSGAGIVEGSVPEDEWDEIENKIVDFRKVASAR